MYWTKCANLCRPKGVGGLGFRNLSAFNKALLVKQVWRIIQSPNSLMARVLKGGILDNRISQWRSWALILPIFGDRYCGVVI